MIESLLARMSAGVPCAMTVPPYSPAPGPSSITQSAALMISISCSTITTELPLAASIPMVERSPSMLLGCRPTDGSSST